MDRRKSKKSSKQVSALSNHTDGKKIDDQTDHSEKHDGRSVSELKNDN